MLVFKQFMNIINYLKIQICNLVCIIFIFYMYIYIEKINDVLSQLFSIIFLNNVVYNFYRLLLKNEIVYKYLNFCLSQNIGYFFQFFVFDFLFIFSGLF